MVEASSNSRLLAVWWLFGGDFIGPSETLHGEHAVQYGDFIVLDITHHDAWGHVNPLGFGADYTELPRGRVSFKIPINQFIVYGPSDLVRDEGFRSSIRRAYGLPSTTLFESDEHYDEPDWDD